MIRILMAEATDYRAPVQVGSHALARQFTSHHAEVMWVGTPIYPHTLARQADPLTRRRINVWRSGGTTLEGVTEYYPFTLLPVMNRPLLRSARVAGNTLRATIPPVRRVIQRHGFAEPDLLWLSNSRFSHALPALVRARVSACRISDDWEHFGNVPPVLVRLHDRMVDETDVVFVTSKRLQEKIQQRRPDAVYLPNAVADFFFSDPGPEPAMLSAFPRPRIIFVGKLDAWVDFDAIARVAGAFPRASVLVVGPGTRAVRNYPENVHFTGAFPYRDLPSLLAACDVGLVPFVRNELTQAVSPLKLFEYLACGLPTVATRLHEIEASRAPARLCDRGDEFPAAVAAVLEGGTDRQSLVDFARENTWSRRFETVRHELHKRGVM